MPSVLPIRKPTQKIPQDDLTVHESCGNVFEDIGLPDPDLMLVKAELIRSLRHAIDDRKLSVVKAAELLKVEGNKFAALLDGQTPGFTIDRLMRMLNKLGQRVEMTVCVRPAEVM